MRNIDFNIIVIRHALTGYSEQNQFMGTRDISCSEKGKRDAKSARKKFSDVDFFRIYCSPLLRAVETSEILFPNRNYSIEPNLIERGLGTWAGQEFSTIKKKNPGAFFKTGFVNPYYTPPNGEAIENVISRVKKFLGVINELYEAIESDTLITTEYNIAIVTHNGIIRVLRYLIESFPISELFSVNEPHLSSLKYNFNGSKWKFISKY